MRRRTETLQCADRCCRQGDDSPGRAQAEGDRSRDQDEEGGTPITRAQAVAWARAQPIDLEVENTFDSYVKAGDDPIAGRISLYGGGRPGSKGHAILKERGMVRKEIRELWGEWEDPAVNFVKSYVAIGGYLENNRFQRAVLADGLREGYIWKKGVSAGTASSCQLGRDRFGGI